MYTEVNKLQIRVESAGSGPVILILHGWGETIEDYLNLSNELKNNYKVVRLELPGFGNSQPPLGLWGPSQYAEFVKLVLQKFKLDNPYAIIAHSLGAQVALYGLAHDLFSCSKFIAVSAPCQDAISLSRRLTLRAISAIGRLTTIFLPGNVRYNVRQKVYSQLGVIDYAMLTQQKIKKIYKYFQQFDTRGDAAFIKTPTLLIYGSMDIDTPPASGQLLHKLIRGSKLTIIPRCGHSPHRVHVQDFLNLAEDFIA